LDLKYKDIGNTVKGAAIAATDLGVAMFNVHAMMNIENMTAAKQGALESNPVNSPKVIGVTLLTDHDKHSLALLGINESVENFVIRLANLARAAGLDGVVCSPKELPVVRYVFGKGATLVTPGIQPAFMAANEQKRVTTPAQAIENGTSMMVIGRAITGAENPSKALDMIAKEIQDAMPNYGTKTLDAAEKARVDELLKLRNAEIEQYKNIRQK
jgi:orotidine-5'-phosphate decarboxylase